MLRTSTAFLTIAVFLISYSTDQQAAQQISWEPSAIQAEVELGDTITADVQFTPVSNMSNLDVVVVPSLRPYVQVSPIEFANVLKGETYSLKLNITLSEVNTLGMIDGVIQLRKGKRVMATPLKLELMLGIPYQNDEFGFSINLPNYPDVYDFQTDEPNILFGTKFTGQLKPEEIVVRVFENPDHLEINEWYQLVRSDSEFSHSDSSIRQSKYVAVRGVEGLQLYSEILGLNLLRTYVPHGNTVIEVSTWHGDPDAYDNSYSEIIESLELF